MAITLGPIIFNFMLEIMYTKCQVREKMSYRLKI